VQYPDWREEAVGHASKLIPVKECPLAAPFERLEPAPADLGKKSSATMAQPATPIRREIASGDAGVEIRSAPQSGSYGALVAPSTEISCITIYLTGSS
jgi:hypothetical protein